MAVTKDEIRLGDVVRLKNGTRLAVDSIFDSYTDRDGEHEGPFVSSSRFDDRHLLSEVEEIVERNERVCAICGGGVTSKNPETDYCRNCFYTGASYERALRSTARDVLSRIAALDGVTDASVWHTGGGCFNLAVTLADGRLLTPSVGLTQGAEVWPEPGIPEKNEKWCLVVSESLNAWEDWDEAKITIASRLFTDDELVAEIARTAKGDS